MTEKEVELKKLMELGERFGQGIYAVRLDMMQRTKTMSEAEAVQYIRRAREKIELWLDWRETELAKRETKNS